MNLFAALTLFVLVLLAPASQAATYEIPTDGSDVVGAVSTVTATFEDTLIDIARRHGLGYEDIVRANPGVPVWVPGEGTEVVLPTQYVLPPGPHEGIVLNLAEYRLYYFPPVKQGEAATVMTFPISIGRRDWETPLGLTKIVSKVVNPAWYPPKSVREEHAAEGRPLPSVVPPGPDNPLGKHAMRLDLPGYLIHGTNRPAGVGMRVTHGCLRMFPEDIEYLFPFITVNTPVRIINEPVKMGWQGESLVMEVHPLLAAAPETTVDEPQRNGSTGVREGDDGGDAGAVSSATLDTGDDPADGDGVIGADEREVHPASFADAEKDPLTYVTERFIVATSERAGLLDWDLVESEVERANGIPAAVGESIKNAATSAAFE